MSTIRTWGTYMLHVLIVLMRHRQLFDRHAAVGGRIAAAGEAQRLPAGLPVINAMGAQHRARAVAREAAHDAAPAMPRHLALDVQHHDRGDVVVAAADAARAEPRGIVVEEAGVHIQHSYMAASSSSLRPRL